MTTEARQFVYGITAIVGIFVTWYFNIQFMLESGGFSILQFVSDNYVNAASASIINDISVAVFTFLFWSFFEARKIGMRNWWVYVVLTFVIAIAFAFPLFMLMRERCLSGLKENIA
ncbi:MAG: DUF2834 domain-containing protein [Proteobacteria bacterium]|nr:DUF2834 domain-containing protein [Pseudomonadota bacterium]